MDITITTKMEDIKTNPGAESPKTKETISTKKPTYSISLPLKKDIIGKIIKAFRKIRKLSQERLGSLIGVQKSQISKLEKSDKNITIGTMIKIFRALKAKIRFEIEVDKKSELAIVQQVIKDEVKDTSVTNLN